MATVARIESSLGFNDSEFSAGIARAEQRAQTFSARAGKSFEGLFKRSPGRRAEQAVSNLVGDLASGNVAGGIANLAGRISGLGLGIGVAIGAGVEIFSKLKGSIDEVSEAREKLAAHMSKPLNLISNLSSGEIRQEVQALSASIDDLQKKQNTFTHSFTNIAKDIAFQHGFGLTDLGKSSMADEMENQQALNRKHAEEKLGGKKALQEAGLEKDYQNDPKALAIAQQLTKLKEREAAIKLAPGKGSQDEIQALHIKGALLMKQYKASRAASQEEFEDAKKLALIQRMGATPAEEKMLTAGAKLKATQRQLARKDLTPEERKSLTLQQIGQENDLVTAGKALKMTQQKNGPALDPLQERWKDMGSRWADGDKGFSDRWSQKDGTSGVGFGSTTMIGKQVGAPESGGDPPAVVAALQALGAQFKDIMATYWGDK